MAKKKATKAEAGVNKSNLIREAHAQKPDAGPTEISRLVSEAHGVEVSPSLVSQVLARQEGAAQKGRPTKRGRGAAKTTKRTAEAVGMTDVQAAADFIKEVGGLEQAQQALAAAKDLREKLV